MMKPFDIRHGTETFRLLKLFTICVYFAVLLSLPILANTMTL